MRTLLTLLALAVLVAQGPQGEALARGGRYRGPAPAGFEPRASPLPAAQAGGRTPSIPAEDWTAWYHHNAEPLEELRYRLYSRIGSNPLFQIPGRTSHARSAATYDIRAEVQEKVIPALLEVLAESGGAEPGVQAAAAIALGKVACDESHVRVLRARLTASGEARFPEVVRESAALALGLLRRSFRGEPFDEVLLESVRGRLFAVVEDVGEPVRTRGFAAMALGLLGDQPPFGDPEVPPAPTTTRLLATFDRPGVEGDLVGALLIALALQPATSFSGEQRARLADSLQTARLGRTRLWPREVAQAAWALGRIGSPASVPVLARALARRGRGGPALARSAAIALGQLGGRLPPEERLAVARRLLASHARLRKRDASAGQFLLMALADLLVADATQGRTDVLTQTSAHALLLETAADGRYLDRPFAALALGRLAAAIPDYEPDPVAAGARTRTVSALRAGFADPRLVPRQRAAFAVALGLAEDVPSVKGLLAWLQEDDLEPDVRGYGALALGLVGLAIANVLPPLRAALRAAPTTGPRLLFATALGLLQDRECDDLLLEALSGAQDETARLSVLVALAAVGHAGAVDPLLALMHDREASAQLRATACAALGCVGDLQLQPSLARLALGANHRDACLLLREVWSFL